MIGGVGIGPKRQTEVGVKRDRRALCFGIFHGVKRCGSSRLGSHGDRAEMEDTRLLQKRQRQLGGSEHTVGAMLAVKAEGSIPALVQRDKRQGGRLRLAAQKAVGAYAVALHCAADQPSEDVIADFADKCGLHIQMGGGGQNIARSAAGSAQIGHLPALLLPAGNKVDQGFSKRNNVVFRRCFAADARAVEFTKGGFCVSTEHESRGVGRICLRKRLRSFKAV